MMNRLRIDCWRGTGLISLALSDAWTQVCTAQGGGTITIPAGDFLTGPVLFKGVVGQKCNGPVTIQLNGNLLGDTDLSKYKGNWLDFQYINGLTITGKGVVNGQGAATWPKSNCQKEWNCKIPPMSLNFAFVNNLHLSGFTSKDSKYFHLDFFSCDTVDIQNLIVTAPGNSPNTDGIHFGQSKNINIAHTTVGTGDDCISIGSGVTNMTISDVHCGPGHGISVGSLGKDGDKGVVSGLTVKDSTLTGTMFGLRIKSWQGKKGGGGGGITITVSDFVYDHITMENVANPIIIDQEYCPFTACPESEPSSVKIKGVKYTNIKGTSSTPELIKLVCSTSNPCEGIELSDIELSYSGNDPKANQTAICTNAIGTASNVKPVTCFA